ncbi:MAG: hypothetical protein KAS16_05500 [Thermoplasmata archaeon]|nr:hypothetical protein [Thermoplasmata archaeon]
MVISSFGQSTPDTGTRGHMPLMPYEGWNDTACSGCHPTTYDEVNSSYHAALGYDVENGGMYNKWCALPNFLLDVQGDALWIQKCGVCHVGGGEVDKLGMEVDCAICHQQSGYNWTARNAAIASGDFHNASRDAMAGVDIDFGTPVDSQCLGCHRKDTGKRAMVWDAEHDVHNAAGLTCLDCHITEDHNIGKGDITDSHVAEHLDGTVKSCDDISCHGATPHDNEYDDHLDIIVCETCHIPTLPGNKALDTTNWSTGSVVKTKHPEEFRPVLAWYDGENAGELPSPSATIHTDGAKIYPYNIILATWWDEGIDPAVVEHPSGPEPGNPILPAHIKLADANGDGVMTEIEVRSLDVDGDGRPDYPTAILREFDVYFSVSHNIVKEGALTCIDCHDEDGILDYEILEFGDAKTMELQSILKIPVDDSVDQLDGTGTVEEDDEFSLAYPGIVPILIVLGSLAIIVSRKRREE